VPRELEQIVVVSGKGGTGKTCVVASFAALAEQAVLADCDVDAPNLALLLHPHLQEETAFWGAKIAVRDPNKCQGVGECQRRCRFGAITTSTIHEMACEGCGLCVLACPNGALTLQPIVNGYYYLSETNYGPLVHARLRAGAESSGRLVTKVRQVAEDVARRTGRSLVLIDGPPGIGCTAVAAMSEVDLAVLVTEPTLSAIHDMQRVVDLAEHFRLPVTVIINKADLDTNNAGQIRAFCRAKEIPVAGELPFDEIVPQAVAAQVPVVEYSQNAVAQAIASAWEKIATRLW
jgi:MinD superfamily P-loop ATPase